MKENGAVKRVISILELISKNPQGLTLGEVYRKLDMPKSTAYDILQTLYAYDAVYYKDPNLKNYVIGSRMYAIGSVYTKNSSLLEVSGQFLREFSEKTGYTTQLAKRVTDKIIYVGKYEPDNVKIITETDVGSIFHGLDKEIAGQCYLTYDKQLGGNIKPNGEYISQLSGSNNHIQNIAVPIKNFENRVVAALVASDLSTSERDVKEVAKELLDVRKQISRALGYFGSFGE
ncbi:MAG TPA: helix-turn-helix domain-containing protein [Acholeplasmataceae bacterium]|nr:helix-turn-helix domain-containing protein [Acholeplasmataceae bacterium]